MILGRIPSRATNRWFSLEPASCILQPKTIFGTTSSRKKIPANKHELSHFHVYKDKQACQFFTRYVWRAWNYHLKTEHFYSCLFSTVINTRLFSFECQYCEGHHCWAKCVKKKTLNNCNQWLCAYRDHTGYTLQFSEGVHAVLEWCSVLRLPVARIGWQRVQQLRLLCSSPLWHLLESPIFKSSLLFDYVSYISGFWSLLL